MEDYFWETKEAMPTNSDTMADFLNSDKHFYSRFNVEAQFLNEDGSYAEVDNGDGKKYAIHASGNGDFFNHKVRFENLT